MRKLRKSIALLLMAAMVLTLSGCGGGGGSKDSKGSSSGGSYKDEVHVATSIEPPSIDPHISGSMAARYIGRYIWEGIVELDSQYKPQLQLAESYDVDEDYKEWTFHLRKGVKFHNGEEMKADDVVASLNRWQEQTFYLSPYIEEGNPLFEKVDDYTVSIKLDKPCYTLLSVLSTSTNFAAIMPKSCIDKATSSGVQEYIGTSSMKFVEWKENSYIHLEKFDDYSAPDKELDGEVGNRVIEFKDLYLDIVADSTTRLAGLQTGDYDVATNISWDNLDQITSDDYLQDYKEYAGGMYIFLNHKTGYFSDKKACEAVRTALDVDEIMAGSIPNKDYYSINTCHMYEKQADWNTDVAADYMNIKDVEKAKQLVKESGYDGHEIVIGTTQEYPELYNASLVLEQQLEAIGIKARVDSWDWSTCYDILWTEEHVSEWDIYPMLYPLAASPTSNTVIMQELGNEYADMTNIQPLLDAIDASKSQEEATEKWQELQVQLYKDEVDWKLADYYNVMVATKDVENFDTFCGYYLWNVKVKDK